MPRNLFITVNASPAYSPGSHWIVLAKRYAYPIAYNPLALPIYSYKHMTDRFRQSTIDSTIVDLVEDQRESNPCKVHTLKSVDSIAFILLIMFSVIFFHSFPM